MEQAIILLVEDNEALNEINRRALEKEGYTVLCALTLAQAHKHLAVHTPDVILLDIMLPDGSGLDFCTKIRGDVDAHILFLTSKTEHEDMLRGLGSGGDDYIAKPYKLGEMLARVGAALRRRRMEKTKPPAKILARGPLMLDLIASRAILNGEDLSLAGKEFALLSLLVRHEGETLTKEYMYEAAWSRPMAGDGNAVRTQLSRLKSKLEEKSDGKISIASYRNEGYTLEIE